MRVKLPFFLCLTAVAVASAAGAMPRVPGPELQVNQLSTLVEQRHPMAAYAPNGTSLVVWEDVEAGLKGRLLGRDGHAVGSDLTLVANQTLTSIPSQGNVIYRRSPAVTFLPNGGFALFWSEEMDFERLNAFLQNDTLLRRDVYGRIFNAAGAPTSNAFRVNGAGERLTSSPTVAARGGDIVVVWQNQAGGQQSIQARRYDFSGHGLGAEIQVSQPNVSSADPAIAVAKGGRVAIAFDAPDASHLGVYVQLFDASFQPQGGEVRVNSSLNGDQRRPAIAVNAAGQYLVAWHGQYLSPQQFRVYGQVVGQAGNLIGGQMALSGGTNRYEVAPSVAAGPHGDFVIVWLAFDVSLPVGIFANQVDAVGHVGSEVQINERAINFNTRSSVAADNAGHFLTAWEGIEKAGPGIAAQLLSE